MCMGRPDTKCCPTLLHLTTLKASKEVSEAQMRLHEPRYSWTALKPQGLALAAHSGPAPVTRAGCSLRTLALAAHSRLALSTPYGHSLRIRSGHSLDSIWTVTQPGHALGTRSGTPSGHPPGIALHIHSRRVLWTLTPDYLRKLALNLLLRSLTSDSR